MSIGTVADLIHSHSQSNQNSLHFQSSFALQLKCVGDVARGMLFLHSQDPLVIHRDLKPQVFPFNLLISIVLFMLFLAYSYRIYWSIDIGTQRYRYDTDFSHHCTDAFFLLNIYTVAQRFWDVSRQETHHYSEPSWNSSVLCS